MSDVRLTSNAAQVAHGLHTAAAELVQLDAVNAEAGALIRAAPAPVGATGALAASVHADVTSNGVTIAGGTAYWTFVHWGAPAIHVIAQPWLYDQTQAKEADLIALYRDHAAEVLARIGD